MELGRLSVSVNHYTTEQNMMVLAVVLHGCDSCIGIQFVVFDVSLSIGWVYV